MKKGDKIIITWVDTYDPQLPSWADDEQIAEAIANRKGESMKRVYVAGAYSADNVLDVLKNIGRGEDMATKLFLLGFAPFCPWHDKDFIIRCPNEKYTVQMFYDYSMAWLEVSDAVFVLPNSEKSKGTQKELDRARELGIPIFDNIPALVMWGCK